METQPESRYRYEEAEMGRGIKDMPKARQAEEGTQRQKLCTGRREELRLDPVTRSQGYSHICLSFPHLQEIFSFLSRC